jgi:hypothetical protein
VEDNGVSDKAESSTSFGMVDDESYDWFVSGEARPITFERRIHDEMMPKMAEGGLTEIKPDMIIFSSLFWDESFLLHVGLAVRLYNLSFCRR